ncbi:hypothetical protein Taro_011399 [Colocasia esculenta]|uniref:Uncharacterized protein n=1 Tax=Colocasia esculenta TaxID=4460 RepID=A0A843U5Q5_COLES|nr:hypothetical protein [Colocasia esculenta]
MHGVNVWLEQVKCRVDPEMKQDLLQFSWSWRPGFLPGSLPLLPQLAAPVFLKLPTGTEGCLEDHGTHGVTELREETSWRGAILVGARGGFGVNREIAGGSSGLRPENLASRSLVAKLLSQNVNGQKISGMADRRDWGGGGDDPEESTQRMIERIWESLTDIRARMDQQAPVPPVAVPPGDGEAVPVTPVPPRVEVPFAAPVPLPPPVLVEEPVMQLPTGTEGCLEDRGTRGVAELREETSWRGAILVRARGGFGVNWEIAGGSSFPTEPVTSEAHPYPHR